MHKGLIHKTTYFKGKGRQEQEGKIMTPKTKGNKERKNYCKKVCDHEENIYNLFSKGEVQLGQMSPGTRSHVYY